MRTTMPQAETGIVAIRMPDAKFRIHETARERLKECNEFLNSIPDLNLRIKLWKGLQDELEWLARIRDNRGDDVIWIGRDQSPLSLGFWMEPSRYHGGLVYHGPDDAGGAYPVLHVLLSGDVGWHTHT